MLINFEKVKCASLKIEALCPSTALKKSFSLKKKLTFFGGVTDMLIDLDSISSKMSAVTVLVNYLLDN